MGNAGANKLGDKVARILCEDGQVVRCDATITTAPNGTGLIEIRRECKIRPLIRRTFRDRDERQSMLALLVLGGRA